MPAGCLPSSRPFFEQSADDAPPPDLPRMPETPTIAATSLLTTVLSCAKPYNGRKKAASSAVVKGKVRRPVRRAAHQPSR